MCAEGNIPSISSSESIDFSKHLNESKLDLNFECVKVFAELFSAFLTNSNWHQHKSRLSTFVYLNSERESYAKETLESNLSSNDLTSHEEQLHNLRLKNPNMLICAH